MFLHVLLLLGHGYGRNQLVSSFGSEAAHGRVSSVQFRVFYIYVNIRKVKRGVCVINTPTPCAWAPTLLYFSLNKKKKKKKGNTSRREFVSAGKMEKMERKDHAPVFFVKQRNTVQASKVFGCHVTLHELRFDKMLRLAIRHAWLAGGVWCGASAEKLPLTGIFV